LVSWRGFCTFALHTATTHSKFVEQQSDKRDGNVFFNTDRKLNAPYAANEVLGNNRSQSGQSWLELTLRVSRGFARPHDWIADAHRGDGKRFVAHADEKLTAFLELQRAVCIHLLNLSAESSEG
jgi:hypothetical protein